MTTTTQEDNILAWPAQEARPAEPVCSVDQIHAALCQAVRAERRIEATIAEIRDRDGTLWLGLTQTMAEGRAARTISGRVDRAARAALDDLTGGLFDRTYLGWTITADVRIGLAQDCRVKATVRDVLQIRPSPTQEAAAAALRDLRSDGVLAAQKQLSEPGRVQGIAVICPAASAGQADVAQVLGRLFGDWAVEVAWLPALFEGRGAEASIAAALAEAGRLAHAGVIDLVLIVRGGGAPASLSYLDAPDLARVVAAMPLPVITGIGHADDRTLLDEVAWHAAATPTDAAQHVIRLIAARARVAPIVVSLPAPAPARVLSPPALPVVVPVARQAAPSSILDARPAEVEAEAKRPLATPEKSSKNRLDEPRELPGYPRIWGIGSIPVQSADHARRLVTMTIAFADGNVPISVVE